MKKIVFVAAILLSCFTAKFASAQVRVNLGLNIGSQPEWGPVGYDHAEYYYIPQIDTYYDVNAHVFVYPDHHQWVRRTHLPDRLANFDLYHAYKVVVNQPTPWMHADDNRNRYANYRDRHDQVVIRDSHEDKYRNHWREH